MARFYPGKKVNGYFPWINGIRTGTILEKRVPLEGEYMMSSRLGGHIIVQRKGSAFLSKSDAERQYWIISLDAA